MLDEIPDLPMIDHGIVSVSRAVEATDSLGERSR